MSQSQPQHGLESPNGQSSNTSQSIFAVFPGQGSQHVGMGKDLYDQFAIAREAFEEASEAIHLDLKKLCFNSSESDLTLTENTQPCLLVASVAAFRVAQKELGFTPTAAAGHSLGEYSALVAIGSLELSSATRWVRERGKAMQKAVPAGEGSMAAIIGLEDSKIEELCKEATVAAQASRARGIPSDPTDPNKLTEFTVPAVVEPANYNAHGQVVIAGSADAIQEAIQLIKSSPNFAGGKAIPLQVSAPFHCKLMKPARDRMAELFSLADERSRPKTPQCAYLPNRTGRFSQEKGIIFEMLIDQVDHPVLWKQSVQTLLDAQYSTSVEFGPGKVLSGLIKRISSSVGKKCNLISVNESKSLKDLETALHAKPAN